MSGLDVVILNKVEGLQYPDLNIVKSEPGLKLTPVDVSGSIAASTTSTFAIQPPSGETWLVYISVLLQSAQNVKYYSVGIRRRIAGGTLYGGVTNAYIANGTVDLGVGGWFWIDNTTYAEIRIYNGDDGFAHNYGYSYFGWKIVT